MSTISSLFAVPLVSAKADNADQLNSELIELFFDMEKQGDKYRNPEGSVAKNEALFESKFTLFDWPHDCVHRLRDFCYATLYGAIAELNGYDMATLKNLHIAVESWFHLTRKGGYFGAHNHPMHSWSGVYCVKHDDDDKGTGSGELTFLSPNIGANAYIDMASARLKPPFNNGTQRLRLEPGQLVLFPSWLLHEVFPYSGNSTRITVAFNARFRMQGVKNLHQVS